MRAWKSSSRKVWPMAGTVVLAVKPGEWAEVVVLPSVDSMVCGSSFFGNFMDVIFFPWDITNNYW